MTRCFSHNVIGSAALRRALRHGAARFFVQDRV
jgi:hypothetical protein